MPEGDYGMSFIDPDKWYAMQKNGETVVVIHDPHPYVSYPDVDRPDQIIKKRAAHGWDGYHEITQIDATTLDVIGGVPTIDLRGFHEWERKAYPSELPPLGWWDKLNTSVRRKK
jgi:hypothetical protein